MGVYPGARMKLCSSVTLIFTDWHGHCAVLEGGGGEKDWECGISRGKLIYIGWIKQQNPPVFNIM